MMTERCVTCWQSHEKFWLFAWWHAAICWSCHKRVTDLSVISYSWLRSDTSTRSKGSSTCILCNFFWYSSFHKYKFWGNFLLTQAGRGAVYGSVFLMCSLKRKAFLKKDMYCWLSTPALLAVVISFQTAQFDHFLSVWGSEKFPSLAVLHITVPRALQARPATPQGAGVLFKWRLLIF